MTWQIEERTREQAQSKIWFQQRAGRVSTSQLKAAVVTNTAQPSQSLINTTCYPESVYFKSEATTWDCKYEEQACRQCENVAKSHHIKLSIIKSGLVVRESYTIYECITRWGNQLHMLWFLSTGSKNSVLV